MYMKTGILHITLCSLLLISCGSASEQETTRRDSASMPQATDSGIAIDSRHLLVTLQRTQCYGGCPVYTLTVSGDGTVVYDGTADVKYIGKDTSRITAAEVRSLSEAIERSRFFSLPDSLKCGEYMTDNPSAIVTIDIGTARKRVDHYQGCRKFEGEEELYALERAIDSIAGSARWVGR